MGKEIRTNAHQDHLNGVKVTRSQSSRFFDFMVDRVDLFPKVFVGMKGAMRPVEPKVVHNMHGNKADNVGEKTRKFRRDLLVAKEVM